jgi:hypothetical protein
LITAIALAGERANESVPNKDPTAATCRSVSPCKNSTLCAKIASNAPNVAHQQQHATLAMVTIVTRSVFRTSLSTTSDPAATPMHARHPLSTSHNRRDPAADNAPTPCRPNATPVSKYPVIFGVFACLFMSCVHRAFETPVSYRSAPRASPSRAPERVSRRFQRATARRTVPTNELAQAINGNRIHASIAHSSALAPSANAIFSQ